MLLPTFCLDLPHRSRLETLPTGNVAAADPVDFKAMPAEQNGCAETQRLLSGTFLKLACRQAWLVMFQRAFFVPLSHKNSIEIFS
jgi:hypothetical protein